MDKTLPASKNSRMRVYLGLFVDVGLPYIAYIVLKNYGLSDVTALSISSVFPIINVFINYLRERKIDGFGIFITAGIVLSVVTSLISHDAHFILVKEAVLTGSFGVICLISMFRSRPLTFYYSRKFATDGGAVDLAKWDMYWEKSPRFRRGSYWLTAIWAGAFIGEAVIRVILSYILTVNQFLAVSNIIFIVILVSLILGSTFYGKGRLARMTQEDLRRAGTVPAKA